MGAPMILSCYRVFSTTISCDFLPLTVISDHLRVISDIFVKLSQENIAEEKESIIGALWNWL